MAEIYRIIVLGNEPAGIPKAVLDEIHRIGADFGLKIGDEIQIVAGSTAGARPLATVGLFIGASPIPAFTQQWLLAAKIPIVPIVSDLANCSRELPKEISHLNAMALSAPAAPSAIASIALECLGLLHMTRAKNQLHLMVPTRFYITQQAARGDRHVYANRSRFIADDLLRAL